MVLMNESFCEWVNSYGNEPLVSYMLLGIHPLWRKLKAACFKLRLIKSPA